MAQFIYFLVNGTVFFYIGIRCRHISFRLIIIVIGNKIFNSVFRKKLFKFRTKLSRQGFIVGEHQCRSVNFFYNIRHCKGFAGACNTHQSLLLIAVQNAFHKCIYCLRLIARRLIFAYKLKFIRINHPFAAPYSHMNTFSE